MKNLTISEDELESLIGKLNHASHILREGRYFLSRLCYWLTLAKKLRRKRTNLSVKDRKDMILWKKFIHTLATTGRSINHSTLTLPNTFCKSDSCYLAMGGYSLEGVAWRYWIPLHLQFRVSINILEFIALQVTVFMSQQAIGLVEGEGNGIKLMAHTDSTSALGWLYHQTTNGANWRKR